MPMDYPLPSSHPADLPPRLARLREEQPIAPIKMTTGEPAYLITRHEDVRRVMADSRFGQRFPGVQVSTDEIDELAEITDLMFLKDGAEHARLRRLVSKAFTPRYMESLREPVRELVDSLIDAMLEAGPPAEFSSAFAVPLAIDVISGMLGVHLDDRESYREWAETSLASIAFTDYSQDNVTEAVFNMLVRVSELVTAKRANLGDDLLSQLIEVHDQHDGRLSDKELLGLSVTLLTAGSISTVAALLRGLVVLLSERERYESLIRNPGSVRLLVEELLRLEAAGGDPMRVAKEDCVVGGVPISAGEVVVLSLTSANRDPKQFPDPEEFKPDRDPNPHLVFGHGAHHCLGAPLARMEMQTALTALAERLPTLDLAVPPDDLEWSLGTLVPMPRKLPLTW